MHRVITYLHLRSAWYNVERNTLIFSQCQAGHLLLPVLSQLWGEGGYIWLENIHYHIWKNALVSSQRSRGQWQGCVIDQCRDPHNLMLVWSDQFQWTQEKGSYEITFPTTLQFWKSWGVMGDYKDKSEPIEIGWITGCTDGLSWQRYPSVGTKQR